MSLLVNEGFEGTGTPSGWFLGGSANFDYTSAPLAGSQSLRCDSATGDFVVYLNGGVLNHGEFWFKLLFKATSLPASFNKIIAIQDGAFSQVMEVVVLSSGALQVQCAPDALFAVTTDVMSSGTLYNIWGHYKKGSGANAVCEVSFDVSGNPRPNAGNKFAGGTNGSTTTNAERFLLGALTSGVYVFDDVQIADTDMFGAAVDVTVNLTGVGASPAVGTLGFNGSLPLVGVAAVPVIGSGTVTFTGDVSVTLTGVTATPSIGIGTVVIEGEVITPPAEDLVPGRMWYGLPEDEKVYLTGVSANPRVGEITPMARGTLEELEKMYPFPKLVPRLAPRRKPKPTAFVYMLGVHPVPKIGSVTTKMFYEDDDEELSSILKMMDVDEEVISALKLAK